METAILTFGRTEKFIWPYTIRKNAVELKNIASDPQKLYDYYYKQLQSITDLIVTLHIAENGNG